jgi:hypothetical protein
MTRAAPQGGYRSGCMALPEPDTTAFTPAPHPPSERWAWLAAASIGLTGLLVLIAVLAGVVGGRAQVAPPVIVVRSATPVLARPAQAIVAAPSRLQQTVDARRFSRAPQVQVARRWMEGFYPIYGTAQGTFGVNWLLIASIHMQETAFSTAPGTYYGLNFAHCCGGPMQFNVTNGPVSTWNLVSDSYRYGKRPAGYDHMTAEHPSIYDDFDAIMAAAHLLSSDGAGYALDGSAWNAAYDYYGHDSTGVIYADQVLARAISWSQHGFCISCGVSQGLVDAVNAAYGEPVMAQLKLSAPAPPRHRAAGHGH